MSELLAVENLDAFYGESQVLFDVSMSVEDDAVVGLFGRNGMGKTTLLRSIVNSIDRKTGTVTYGGEDITETPTHEIAQRGLSLVPEGRDIYPDLTVRENLELAAPRGISETELEDRIGSLYDRFERLEERATQAGGTLSGGEQQMLALARGLVTEPDLLLLDEPTEGLAPIIVDDVIEILEELTAQNQAVVLVEQNITRTLPLIDRGYMIENGRIVAEGDAARLEDEELQERYLTI